MFLNLEDYVNKNFSKEKFSFLKDLSISQVYFLKKFFKTQVSLDVSNIKNNSLLVFYNLENISFLETFNFKSSKKNINYLFINCKNINFLRDFSLNNFSLNNNFYLKNSSVNLTNLFFDSNYLKFFQKNYIFKNGFLNQNDLSLLSKEQRVFINIKNNHLYKNTISNSTIKNVLKDSSLLRYDGLINIIKKADFSNAYLETNNMLLSKKANSINVPMLEIEPKNIKATHAATVEHVTDDQLFYLGSRGILKNQSYNLIVSSFLKSNISFYPDAFTQYISTKINEKL